jgi:hypothetical protein
MMVDRTSGLNRSISGFWSFLIWIEAVGSGSICLCRKCQSRGPDCFDLSANIHAFDNVIDGLACDELCDFSTKHGKPVLVENVVIREGC